MKLSSDAMTVLVGLLNDLNAMQRKVEAGQGATCEVSWWETPSGEVRVTFEASIDPGFRIKPISEAERFLGEGLLRNGPTSFTVSECVDVHKPHFPGRDPRNEADRLRWQQSDAGERATRHPAA